MFDKLSLLNNIYFLAENPQFNEAFEFEIAFPELALVRFVVLDDDSLDYDFMGQYTLPFECIQTGTLIFRKFLFISF